MLASALAPALLLLASAVAAQETPSVVTGGSALPSASISNGLMSIPPGETPEPTSVLSIITDPILSSATGIITDPILSSATGIIPFPPGETPMSTGYFNTTATSQPSLSSNGTSPTSSSPPQQSTNAAAPAWDDDGTAFVVALAGAAFALI